MNESDKKGTWGQKNGLIKDRECWMCSDREEVKGETALLYVAPVAPAVG